MYALAVYYGHYMKYEGKDASIRLESSYMSVYATSKTDFKKRFTDNGVLVGKGTLFDDIAMGRDKGSIKKYEKLSDAKRAATRINNDMTITQREIWHNSYSQTKLFVGVYDYSNGEIIVEPNFDNWLKQWTPGYSIENTTGIQL